ncbi:MAG: pyridoxal-dependent decarboxylase [Bacteroidota bacterium]|nr:pyridoxal-dependent decarboxylase [Bacteroidota bacterium]MDX5404175.1 pyridoxal-dependent decarboxylase [Bacteroidota bacterium]MDX5427778.1 pyridoxal-dependent decarboxylase [Bacteroidota bacterium]MDX5447557.1 pyridoxal-dependent decarboxylase [Bacteroidota bacterium]MDX5505661.1 pyridoxal-dependent decarboxylase [Bacteroidota bacterium]
MALWKKLSHEEICQRVFKALGQTIDFQKTPPLGLPASRLDEKVFYNNPLILKDAPFLSSLIQNPNHIGCHTLGESEPFFRGTQQIEKEVIRICAEDILNGDPEQQDGYIASGGTEANIQAMWIYRNLFIREFGARPEEIRIVTSSDAHYSMHKASNLLGIGNVSLAVDEHDRTIQVELMREQLEGLKKEGVRYLIGVANMMTTMFGSVDDVHTLSENFKDLGFTYRIHVDGAYGGFAFPFFSEVRSNTFSNPEVSSITLDAHKMVQAPYGTGIFLCRKGLINYVYTQEAQYVAGLDATLSGSRSGANAIAVWMILQTYGPHGWKEKIHLLSYRGNWLAEQLNELGVRYYRYPKSNILTLDAKQIPESLAEKFGLVPDSHGEHARWYKIVIMDHVTIDNLLPFVNELKNAIL